MNQSLKFSEQVVWHIKYAEFIAPEDDRLDVSMRIKAVAGFADYLQVKVTMPEYPELLYLVDWLNTENLTSLYQQYNPEYRCLGSNKVFQLAPENYDISFIYTLLFSAIYGCKSVTRINELSNPIAKGLLELLKLYMQKPQGKILKSYIAVIEYSALLEHVTVQITTWSDRQVVWGSGRDANQIDVFSKNNQLVYIPELYSAYLLDLSKRNSVTAIAKALIRDVFTLEQRSYASPKVVLWVNTDDKQRAAFWDAVAQIKPDITRSASIQNKVDQHLAIKNFREQAESQLQGDSIKLVVCGAISRVMVHKFEGAFFAPHKASGLVFEFVLDSTLDLSMVLQELASPLCFRLASFGAAGLDTKASNIDICLPGEMHRFVFNKYLQYFFISLIK